MVATDHQLPVVAINDSSAAETWLQKTLRIKTCLTGEDEKVKKLAASTVTRNQGRMWVHSVSVSGLIPRLDSFPDWTHSQTELIPRLDSFPDG